MTDQQHERALERRIAAALDREVATQDPALMQRLDRARRAALAEADSPRRAWLAWPALATAGTAALVAVLVLVQPDRRAGPDIPALPKSEDLDLLTQQEFELFAEDPEFYAWIAERPLRQQRRVRGGSEEEST